MAMALRSAVVGFFGGILVFSSSASASSICDSFRGAGQERKLANCETIVKKGLVPNRDALRYTINYLNDNHNGLRDATCAVNGIEANDRCIACRSREWVEKGVENDCTFIINDLSRPWRRDPAPRRTTAYLVDLCSDDPSKLVSSFYINGGTGNPRFDDSPDRGETSNLWNKNTLAGAFLVEGKVYGDFVPGRAEKYAGIRSRHNGEIPGMRMIGLNSSNNTTESSKPLHVSPFRTSWGCSGVSESTIPIMERFASSGKSSLFMAYAGQKYEQKGTSCTNDSSDAGRTSPGSQSPGSAGAGASGAVAPANSVQGAGAR